MTKPDDSSLSPSEYAAVRKAALAVLNKTSAWGRFPTPISDVMDAAELKVAPVSAFDPRAMERYLREAGHAAFKFLKKAIDKVLGVFDVHADTVHIDDSVHKHKQNFLKLHETGHKEIPHQRGLFKWIQDCTKTLSPDVADLFDREANNFASLVLFQDDTFAKMTADSAFGIKVPLNTGSKFGASAYAATREYVRRNAKACAVVILEPPEVCSINGFTSAVRRIEYSADFLKKFGHLQLPATLNPDHSISSFIPVAPKRMSWPGTFSLEDRNGVLHEFVGEGFSSGYQVLILIHSRATLNRSTIILPKSA